MSVRIDNVEHCTSIDQISVPEKLRQRYAFHDDIRAPRLRFVTNLYGGQGITPSTMTLFSGTPGSGKSTLLLQIANALHSRNDCMVLFNGGEESLFQTRLVCERLFKKNPTFFVGQDTLVDDESPDLHFSVRHQVKTGARRSLLGHARTLKKKFPDKHLIIIQDSLQTTDDGRYADGFTNGQTPFRSMKLINDHCKKTFDSAIVIGQVNKNGDIAGANKLLHETDVWLHMHVDGKDKSETKGMRLIATRKNRYGYGGQCHILSMWDDGMKEEGSLNEE